MALFESYERRIDQITPVLEKYGMKTLEDAKAVCAEKGVDPYTIAKETQPIAFENAGWAYTLGAAIAIKKGCVKAADAAEAIGEGLQAFCIPGSGKKYFSVASGGGTGRTLHPDNMAAGPASYGMTDTMGRMHSDAQFAGSSSVPAHVEMMGLIGMGNNPMVGATVAVAVSVEEAMSK